MVKIREIYNENYMGYIIEDDSKILSNAISIIQKGNIEGLIKGYLLKQNGKSKVIYPVNSYRNFYYDINIVNQDTFEKVMLSIITFYHRVANDTILPIECIDFTYKHIFYEPSAKRIKLLAIPALDDISPNSRRAYENSVKNLMQDYISHSSFFQSKTCYSLFYDLKNVNTTLDVLYNNMISGKYGSEYEKINEAEITKPVYKLVPADMINPVFVVQDERTIVGRSFSGEGFALNVQGISRQHSEIVWQGNALYIRDLTSTNGTFVNNTRIFADQYVPLMIGDKIRFSNIEYEVQVVTNE